MDDILLSEVNESLKDVLDDGSCLMLVEVTVFAESRLEITFIAEFSDDVAVAVACEDLETFEHIGVTQFLENINF